MTQISQSIEKLLHYLAVYVTQETEISVSLDKEVFRHTYKPVNKVSISPTLFTRIDGCHGAGNCCRVPFDLVYTHYDFMRIVNFDQSRAKEEFGSESAEGFSRYRESLLQTLIRYECTVRQGEKSWVVPIFIKENKSIFELSGTKSCPYLIMSDNRYFCGVHPFKPLHCWYPHMVVRSSIPRSGGELPDVTIGRMQYGRNHKFGCPVILYDAGECQSDGELFPTDITGENYFPNQFQSDIAKLEWTSKSAASLGFDFKNNFAVGIDRAYEEKETQILSALQSKNKDNITLYKRRS